MKQCNLVFSNISDSRVAITRLRKPLYLALDEALVQCSDWRFCVVVQRGVQVRLGECRKGQQ